MRIYPAPDDGLIIAVALAMMLFGLILGAIR